jgi:hypothetical protein
MLGPLEDLLADQSEREAEFHALADNMSQLAWMTDEDGLTYWFKKRWLDYPAQVSPT